MSTFDPIGCCGKFGASAAYSCCACRPNRRGLASAYPKITSMFFVHAEAVRPQKAVVRPIIFPGRTGTSPLFAERSVGTKVKEASTFTAGSAPNDGRPRKRLVWGDKAKPLASLADGFAVRASAFLCWPSLHEKSKCGRMLVRLTPKAGRGTSPTRPKDANFGLDDGEAFFFGPNANHDMHLPTR